ncbi:MT-A70 family methyltransferase [uncultured Agrobacterium sp.]|uniref:MT-A70 family methyltransferase n=1 Tax=uncultured Agrobacterium sp. TaxID=157277 RepID=UPI00258AC3A1|nr:MT-A70 family methyltransferase [uncultured Agrobacterium sp.]
MTEIGGRMRNILTKACSAGFYDIQGEGDRKSACSLHVAGHLARDPKVSGRFYPTTKGRAELGSEAEQGRLIAITRDAQSIDAGNRLRHLDEKTVIALMESFSTYGQQAPIIVYGTETDDIVKLGAGGHRLEACKRLGIGVLCFHKNGDELDRQLCEIDENLIRADLTPADRALFLARRKEIYLTKHPETAKGASQAGATNAALGRGGQIVRDVKPFAAATAQSTGQDERTIRRDVERGEKISQAALQMLRGTRHDKGVTLDQMKRLETHEAQEVFARDLVAADKAIAAESKHIRTMQLASNRQSRMMMVNLISEHGRKSGGIMPRAAYPIGYADPPWQQEAWSDETGQDKGLMYPSMPLDEIKALCAGENSPFTPDAVLFLWVPFNRIDDGIEVLKAWGFEYVTAIAWDKVDIGMGRWVRDRAELLLIGKRGKISLAPEMGKQPHSLYAEKKSEHSRKPVWFAEQIERIWPGLRKLELFQRRESLAEGDVRLNGRWEFWGNQAGTPEGGAA